jgi:hypothetical protein
MAINTTNAHGMNISWNDTTPGQFGHFIRDAFSGAVAGMEVSQNGTPNMSVNVAPGSAILTKNTVSSVIAEVKATTNVVISTASTSNPRIDTIIIYEDTTVSNALSAYIIDGAGGSFKLASVVGTPGASPTAPNDAAIQAEIGAGKPWARIADVTVPTSTTTIINSNISDERALISPSYVDDSLITQATRRLGLDKKTTTATTLTTGYVTYATVTATSNGGEVEIDLRAHFTNANSGANRSAYIKVQCDGVDIEDPGIVLNIPNLGADTVSGSIFSFIYSHTPSAGSHTWTFQTYSPTSSAVYLNKARLRVQELAS